MMFLPARAYVPPGTLRTALCYPCSTAEFKDYEAARALGAVGLERLVPQLDSTDRWDHRLTDEEKQSLALARVLLQRPQWLVLNGVLDAIDEGSRRRLAAILQTEFPGVGLINIAGASPREGFFTRTLRLVTDVRGPSFSPTERGATVTQE